MLMLEWCKLAPRGCWPSLSSCYRLIVAGWACLSTQLVFCQT